MAAIQHAFTASDLATRRREVLDASRKGVVFVRDTDGAVFAMMRAEVLSLREDMETFNRTLRALISSLTDDSPSPASLGLVAFAADWPVERRRQLVADLAEAIAVAESLGDPAPAAGLIEASRPRPTIQCPPFDASAAFAGLSSREQAILSGVRRSTAG